MNLIWSCTPGADVRGSFGGYSDRLKGIVTAYLLARKTDRSFWIEWNGAMSIGDYFDSMYYWNAPDRRSPFFRLVDGLETAGDIHSALHWIRQAGPDLKISANQYGPVHWAELSGQGSMQSIFGLMLQAIFRPKEIIFAHPAYLELRRQMGCRPVLGLAIRIGDQNWDRLGSFRVPSDDQVLAAVASRPEKVVLLVSDSPEWKRRMGGLLTDRDVVMLDYKTANPDRSPAEEAEIAFPVFLIEHFLLQRCTAVITGDGGGGRTAAWWGGIPCIELIQ